jgi:general secretion pathway protein N
MIAWLKVIGWTLLLGAASTMNSSAVPAATSASLDILSNDAANEPAGSVELGGLKPIVEEPNQTAKKPPARGNPLWWIPLSALSATRERPVFSASRRPPPAAVVAPTAAQVNLPVPPKTPPARPPLALIGAVVGESDAIAVFLDQTNQKIVRLHQGESLAGWELSSVQRREVMLKQAERTEILSLGRPDDRNAAPGAPGLPGASLASGAVASPDLTMPVGAASFAPFVPQSMPKNGRSDGL